MATVDWTKLVEDESDEDHHFNAVPSMSEKQKKADENLPVEIDYLDPETSIRTVVKYERMTPEEIEANGDKYNTRKITYKYKVERKKILQCVARRKHLKKFGVAEEIDIQYTKPPGGVSTFKPAKEESQPILKFTCSHCGLDHQSITCPTLNRNASHSAQTLTAGSIFAAAASSSSSKYVAPGLRGSSSAATTSGISGMDASKPAGSVHGLPEEPTIRVTNLPSETREQDLRELFGAYGHITRVYVPRDLTTREAKGYAFITFDTMHPARLAAKLMNNYNYANMALNVEVVQKPRNPRP